MAQAPAQSANATDAAGPANAAPAPTKRAKRQKLRRGNLPAVRLDRSAWHELVFRPKSSNCQLCSLNRHRTQTVMICSRCDVVLCKGCWNTFHRDESPSNSRWTRAQAQL